MYSSRRKSQEEVPVEVTAVWSCTNDNCNGWMRDNFTFSEEPTCPHCQSPMEKSEKKLSVLVNTNHNQPKEEAE